MADLDGLVGYLEALDECLKLKRAILVEECRLLSSLLKPWKGHRESKADTEKLPERKCPEVTSAEHAEEELLDPINEELERATKLLEKVHKVRRNVRDKEVRSMCNLEDITTDTLPDIKMVSKGATKSQINNDCKQKDFKGGQPQKTSGAAAAKTSSKRMSQLKPRPVAQTNYQSSFKPPSAKKFGRGVGQVTSKPKSKFLTTDNSRTAAETHSQLGAPKQYVPEKIVDITNNPAQSKYSGVRRKPGAENNVVKSVMEQFSKEPVEEPAMEPFTLCKNGKELRVPKSLRAQLKLQYEFRSKADDMLRQPLSATVLPDKLGRYFSLNENIP